MKKWKSLFSYTVLFLLVLYGGVLPNLAKAEIFRDANSTVNTTADPVTWSHTGTANATVAVVGFSINNTSDVLSNVTWDGVNMVLVDKGPDPSALGGGWTYLYWISIPSTTFSGSKTISIDMTGSNLVRACAETYLGTATGTLAFDVKASSTVTSATSITVSTTTTKNGVTLFNWTQDYGGTPTPGNSESQIQVVANNICTDFASGLAGSKSMTTLLSGTVRAAAFMVGLKPATTTSETTTTSTFMSATTDAIVGNFFGYGLLILEALAIIGIIYLISRFIK